MIVLVASVAGVGNALGAISALPFIAAFGTFVAIPIGYMIAVKITDNLNISHNWKHAINLTAFAGLSAAVLTAAVAMGVLSTAGVVIIGTIIGITGLISLYNLVSSVYETFLLFNNSYVNSFYELPLSTNSP